VDQEIPLDLETLRKFKERGLSSPLLRLFQIFQFTGISKLNAKKHLTSMTCHATILPMIGIQITYVRPTLFSISFNMKSQMTDSIDTKKSGQGRLIHHISFQIKTDFVHAI
jgi:hypothetical protein